MEKKNHDSSKRSEHLNITELGLFIFETQIAATDRL
jgi:hypothetical protein